MAWKRLHQLLAWDEEMSEECSAALSNIFLQVGVEDRWSWHQMCDKYYTINGVYQLLTTAQPHTQHDLQEIIWNKTILLKPSIFAWRILRNRIPAKDNPVKRRILQENMNVCVDGCGYEENIYHLCLGC
jgi:hypothetical protein